MHERSKFIEALEAELQKEFTLVPATDAVQEDDVPCVVVEERQETAADLDETLQRPPTRWKRRLTLIVWSYGKTKRDRDDLSENVEKIVAPALWGAGFHCALVGVGYARTKVGTSAMAFAAGSAYEVQFYTPTHAPAEHVQPT